MKKFIAALAGAAIIATPLAASAAPSHPIPHGTLRCSSFTTRLAEACNTYKGNGGSKLDAAHWRFDGTSIDCWQLSGSDPLYRCATGDFLG